MVDTYPLQRREVSVGELEDLARTMLRELDKAREVEELAEKVFAEADVSMTVQAQVYGQFVTPRTYARKLAEEKAAKAQGALASAMRRDETDRKVAALEKKLAQRLGHK